MDQRLQSTSLPRRPPRPPRPSRPPRPPRSPPRPPRTPRPLAPEAVGGPPAVLLVLSRSHKVGGASVFERSASVFERRHSVFEVLMTRSSTPESLVKRATIGLVDHVFFSTISFFTWRP